MTVFVPKTRAYGNELLPLFNTWVDRVERDFEGADWDAYIEKATGGDKFRILDHSEAEGERTWIEASPLTRGDPSLNFLSRVIYDRDFDLYSPKLVRRFEDLLRHLHPYLTDQWVDFELRSAVLHGCPYHQIGQHSFDLSPDADEMDLLMPVLVQDFCDHALFWAYMNNIGLFHPNFDPDPN